ncbi:NAD-dependent epimerase/dehydratase family protein [Primorskyibacter sp. 2E233]|uniref:NAD-dependent epimerase/dehydratase family protein n=1 Tax=Primorskyibacter sp. 2E233 TaxID=3413431 RepID=UPI003BEFAEF3
MRKTVVSNRQSRRILLLGASGMLGRMLRAVWQKNPPQDTEVTPVFRGRADDAFALQWHPGAQTDGLPKIDAVVAMWGVKPGSDAALEENTALAIAAQELARDLGATKVLHASSAAIYQPGPDPLDEEASQIPPTPYGKAKLDMEAAVAHWHAENPTGPESVLMRIGNVAGADSIFLNLAKGDRIRLDRFSDGSAPARSYIAPQDLAGAIVSLLRSDITGPVNLSAPVATGMDQIALAAGSTIDWVPAPETALPKVQLDCGRLQTVYTFNKHSAEATYLVDSARATGVWP